MNAPLPHIHKQLQIPGIGGGVLPGELIVDLFAGGGGASTGIEAALGRPPDIAINHDPAAIQMHMANHPATHHLCESIYDVDPRVATNGQAVGVLWASPSCTHFSRARGGTPVSKQERGLGWQVARWAGLTRPRVIFCENVPEWKTWGPVRRTRLGKKRRAARRKALLGPGNSVGMDNRGCRPVKKRSGQYFLQLMRQLSAIAYRPEWRDLNAAEYDTPTTRKRLYVVARRDGEHVVWPAPTNGPKADKPFRTAAECVDWTDLGKSIFDRKKPLAPATCRRIAAGIVRYVIEAARPFIVTCNHGKEGFRGQSIDEPMRTLTASRDAHGIVSPVLVTTGHGERAGQAPRANSVEAPLGTVVATAQNHALVTAFLAKHYGGVVGHGVEQPLGTVTSVDHHSLVAAHLEVFREDRNGRDLERPMPTLTAGGGKGGQIGLVATHVTTIDQQSNANGSTPADAPLSTVTHKQRHALVAAFLTTYYTGGGSANGVDAPMPAIVTKARHGLVTLDIDGVTYAISDIRLRMLKPEELARAQGFPVGYVLTGTQAEKIGRIGNSVCPPVAAALAAANLPRPERAKRGAA